MDLLPLARLSLATLRAAMDVGLAAMKEGKTVPEEVGAFAEKALLTLDLYLTGLNGGSCRRDGELRTLWEGSRIQVYLSDGGYSRLTLDILGEDDMTPILGMDRTLSRPHVIARWDALKEP